MVFWRFTVLERVNIDTQLHDVTLSLYGLMGCQMRSAGVQWVSSSGSHSHFLYFSTVFDCRLLKDSQQGGASYFSRMNALSTVNILSPASHCDEQTDTNRCVDEWRGEWRTGCLCCSQPWWKVQQQNKGRITHLEINCTRGSFVFWVYRGSS